MYLSFRCMILQFLLIILFTCSFIDPCEYYYCLLMLKRSVQKKKQRKSVENITSYIKRYQEKRTYIFICFIILCFFFYIFVSVIESNLPWVPEDIFFLIDTEGSRRSRVNENGPLKPGSIKPCYYGKKDTAQCPNYAMSSMLGRP